MSLASHLQTILEKLQIADDDRATYTSHAESIRNELMEDLQKFDHFFRSAFNGLNLTGSYLDRVKLKTPDEFDMQIKLKFPFEVKPVRDYDRDGFVFLYAPSGNYHPAVKNNYVSNEALQTWLRKAFHNVLNSNTRRSISGERYDLKYELQGYGCAHTIVASSDDRTISFDFVPVFEYNYNSWPLSDPPVSYEIRQKWPWFAVPQKKAPSSERTFMVSAPQWEREMMKGKDNLKNALRLMKAMRDSHKDEMPHLSSYMLKTVILLNLNISPRFWQNDLPSIYTFLWSKLNEYFLRGNLPFFLAKGCNHFDRLNQNDRQKCKDTTAKLLIDFRDLYNNPYVSYDRVARLFL